MGYKPLTKNPGNDLFKFEEPGDTLEGYLITVRDIQTRMGPARVADFDTGEKIFSVFLPTQLAGLIDEGLVGEKLRIIYKGLVKSKAGRGVKDFEVSVWED